jgi:hypothetical protein
VWAAINWADLHVAGAFVLGAVLATIACLRVVRAVAVMFGDAKPRRWRRPAPDDPDDL